MLLSEKSDAAQMQLGREVLKSLGLLWAIAPVAHAAQGGLGPASPPQGGPGCSRDALQQPFPRQTLSCLTTPSLPSSGAKWGSLDEIPTFLMAVGKRELIQKTNRQKNNQENKIKRKKKSNQESLSYQAWGLLKCLYCPIGCQSWGQRNSKEERACL